MHYKKQKTNVVETEATHERRFLSPHINLFTVVLVVLLNTDVIIAYSFSFVSLLILQGDSGGPFVCNEGGRWVLRGAVSWGHQNCRTDYFTVFARVSTFVNWINQKTSGGKALECLYALRKKEIDAGIFPETSTHLRTRSTFPLDNI